MEYVFIGFSETDLNNNVYLIDSKWSDVSAQSQESGDWRERERERMSGFVEPLYFPAGLIYLFPRKYLRSRKKKAWIFRKLS